MKVAELKKGMLLECENKDWCFIVTSYGDSGPWVRAAHVARRSAYAARIREDSPKFVMYLGTKKDVNVKVSWSNRIVLVDNIVAAVDPASWKWMREMNESR
tara:strand:+ start:466 stop:768 length:303 start_codon:yes stop_codon:yes gene_type:complete